MAETPKKVLQSPPKSEHTPRLIAKSSPTLTPVTPQTTTPRRSARRACLGLDSVSSLIQVNSIDTPSDYSLKKSFIVKDGNQSDLRSWSELVKGEKGSISKTSRAKRNNGCEVTPISSKNVKGKDEKEWIQDSFSPKSPEQLETKKRKSNDERKVVTRAMASRNGKSEKKRKMDVPKRKMYYKKVVHDGGEFEIGDSVYMRRREDASSDNEDPEVEECRMCLESGDDVMLECDDCLGGFHLKCLKPPLKEIPEGDWICEFCEAHKEGRHVEFPVYPEGKERARTLREKLLSSDLWAARIESIWKDIDGSYWYRARWYIIPEETAAGRQAHNLKREIYRTNDFADVEMESVLRHCNVLSPKEYAKATDAGDDVFLCEYEYDVHWHSLKRLSELDDDGEDGDDSDCEDWKLSKDIDSDGDEDIKYDDENIKNLSSQPCSNHELPANLWKGKFFGLQKIGTKKIPDRVRSHKQTDLERAKSALLLASTPKSLPCRNQEMEEITAFVRSAVCDDHCLGRCLYIHGVPGTGKTMSVLAVMRALRSEVEAGTIRPYSFVETNGLKLASPEHIYKVIYESLNGHRVCWRKALHLLTERFVDGKRKREEDDRPCILLIDELDLLVTRNQSVLYNIFDWPTKPHSKLVVIGVANTMDLPEKLLPRISSRMGMQRLCFVPYNYQQLQEIISSRLKGMDAFDKLAIEFASRKVAAISGDARRALEICRRAAEIADYRVKNLPTATSVYTGKNLVSMADVDTAIQEMFQAPHIQVMKSNSRLGKIFLTAMVHELYRTGMRETTFEKLVMTVSNLCTSNNETFPGYHTLLQVGCRLGESRIILCEPGSKHK